MSNSNSMAKSAILVSGLTVFTLVFSFAKEAVFASYYGTSYITDAYSIAIQIPTTLFAMLSMAISSVALPYYSKKIIKDGPEIASIYISNLMTLVSIITVTIVLVLEVFPELIIGLFAPGLSPDASRMATLLFRLVLPTIVFTELININTAILDVHKSFLLPQLGSVVLNTIFVAFVSLFAEIGGIYAAVYGTVIGSIVEFGYSVLLRRKYMKYQYVCDVSDNDVTASLKKSTPVFLGIGIEEINKTIDTIVTSFLEAGSVSMMGYASKVTSAISSLFISGIMKVTYPEYAESAAKNDDIRMADCLLFAIKIVFLLLFPIVFGGALLSKEIISAVFYRGAFGIAAVFGTASIFTAYLACLIFRGLRQSFARVFYSYGDTRTPMMNGFIGLLVNTILDLSLYKTFGAAGVAWATTATYVVVSGLLGLSIKKKNKFIQYHLLLPFLFRVLLSCVFMSAIIMVLKEFFIYIGLYDITNISKNITFLVFTVVLGAIFYFVGLLLLKTTEAINIVKVICRRKK